MFRKLRKWPLFVTAYTAAWFAALIYVWLSWHSFAMSLKVALTIVLILTTPALSDLVHSWKRDE